MTQSFCLIFSANLRVLCVLCIEAEASELIPIFQVEFASIRVKSLFPSGFWILHPVFSAAMFETVKTDIATATGKLTHLRRFL